MTSSCNFAFFILLDEELVVTDEIGLHPGYKHHHQLVLLFLQLQSVLFVCNIIKVSFDIFLGSLADCSGNVHVILDSLLEDLNGNLLLQGFTDLMLEICQLFLLILSSHGRQQVKSYLFLGFILQLHVIHGSVSLIDLLLEIGRLLLSLTDTDGHLTENVTIDEDQDEEG